MNELPTYQELLTANRQLLAENELLRKENAKLSELVKSIIKVGEGANDVEVSSSHKDSELVSQEKKFITTPCLSLEEKVTLFSSLFKGREDVFARRWYSKASGRTGYQPVCDTLFLALPVFWKGIIAQYAGRLHRDYPGKKVVQVYDYIDIHIPMCDMMYKRRLKGYATVGYKIRQNDPKDLFGISQGVIFTGKNYQNSFFQDLSKASKSIIISTTKLWFAKRAPILELLKELSVRGVEVIVFTRQLSDKEKVLLNGVQVNVKENCHFMQRLLISPLFGTVV